jgi:ankyrin repeat protein
MNIFLEQATEQGHLDVVKLLLEYGADVNTLKEKDEESLKLAFKGEHFELVNFILKEMEEL